MKHTTGIHHVTAIVGNPQENVDFYAGVLGLRLVKKTVNFDDPGTYHLYFGNEQGSPGTIITFFPWPDAYQGRIGSGQVGVTTYVVPKGSLTFWEDRLSKFGLAVTKYERFGEMYLEFDDPHGLHLEITEREEGPNSAWAFGGVPAQHAIKGFGGAVLLSADPLGTMRVLTDVMGLTRVGEEGDFIRFRASGDLGNIIDVKQTTMAPGRMGVGTVHHIAWRADDFSDHEAWREHVSAHGHQVTPIVDRQYFNAIYFREPGAILFEIATDPPGFLHNEPFEQLGEKLLLPPWLEPKRAELERILLPAEVRVLKEDL
ncbi:ring-cleaving dioxygenase [Ectobacillus sp. JY-23]|uniref:ring-cleaving dioxygenase n=1 Tax=Ectobacillus sp. JY-23 TaxID=2933872 RepID=UPI001FF575D8|nr:ring-cleaving dioxygenase [Ectobacillus sp. JY-23]UOY91218.1 ring-cleaving dioxygenase [Ectobacillus sp. JY-23]